VRVQLCYFEGCPNVQRARDLVTSVLALLGLSHIVVEERLEDCASPTLLVDGVDVSTGAPLTRVRSCRLALPTEAQLVESLTRGRMVK
jgi:hypothetical protein